MGSVVGEKFSRAADYAAENNVPMISFCGQWWRTHAGSTIFAAADGQNIRCAGAHGREASAFYISLDGSDNRRRVRQSGNAG